MKLVLCCSLLFVSVSLSAAIPAVTEKQTPKTQSADTYNEFIKLAFTNDLNMSMRWKSLMAAASLRKEKATPDLLKASKDSQWYMRNAAMVALAEYNPPVSQKVAKRLIKDKALVVRSAAVDILAKGTDAEARRLLWQEINKDYNFKNNKSLWIRPQIVAILSEKPVPSELSSFQTLLQDSELNIQLLAIQGLEKITGVKLGDSQTAPSQLVQMWKDKKVN